MLEALENNSLEARQLLPRIEMQSLLDEFISCANAKQQQSEPHRAPQPLSPESFNRPLLA